MNSNQIQCFVESARGLSFTGAAAGLYLSPQAVSKQVVSLEEELGVRLFDRNGPRLALTEAGELYFNLFSGLDRQYSFMLEDVTLYRKSQQMGLSIGVSEWIDPAGEFTAGITSFRDTVSGCKVSVSVYPNLELLDALNKGRIDCAFFSEAQLPQGPDYQAQTVATEEVMLYAPADLGGGPAREDCWGLPLLMVPAWNWSRTELRVAGARETTSVRLAPAGKRTLPNVQSLYAAMEFSRGVTLGGSRFNYLTKIPPRPAPPPRDKGDRVWQGLRRDGTDLWGL
ncbi:MAG: LysR family transcriptional regulator, partial [Oscillospiraceae bacterium]|nr:LysR family transcriptional regulator [Oscillospiraceae bacterium]